MCSLQEMLDREIVRHGPDVFMVKQFKNQIIAEKINQSTLQMYSIETHTCTANLDF
jgi:hypothetical protein